MRSFLQKSQKPSRSEIPSKRSVCWFADVSTHIMLWYKYYKNFFYFKFYQNFIGKKNKTKTQTYLFWIICSRECPTSTSTEEEAIQGMLSMAGLHYPTCLQMQVQSTDNSSDKQSLQDPSCHSSNHEVRQSYHYSRPMEYGKQWN